MQSLRVSLLLHLHRRATCGRKHLVLPPALREGWLLAITVIAAIARSFTRTWENLRSVR